MLAGTRENCWTRGLDSALVTHTTTPHRSNPPTISTNPVQQCRRHGAMLSYFLFILGVSAVCGGICWVLSMLAATGYPVSSTRTPTGYPVSSRRTPTGYPVSSRRTPTGYQSRVGYPTGYQSRVRVLRRRKRRVQRGGGVDCLEDCDTRSSPLTLERHYGLRVG